MSYFTPLTGRDLDDGEELDSVLAAVKSVLGPDLVLVGKGIKNDVEWLKLCEGEDYSTTVDLEELFKTYDPRYHNDSYFSLSHEANILLRRGWHWDGLPSNVLFLSDQHDPVTNATASIRLFKNTTPTVHCCKRPSKGCCETILLHPGPSGTTTAGREYALHPICHPSVSVEPPQKRLSYGSEKQHLTSYFFRAIKRAIWRRLGYCNLTWSADKSSKLSECDLPRQKYRAPSLIPMPTGLIYTFVSTRENSSTRDFRFSVSSYSSCSSSSSSS